MTTDSSVLACRIPWTEEPGRLQSIGLHRVRHNWSHHLAHMHTECKKSATTCRGSMREATYTRYVNSGDWTREHMSASLKFHSLKVRIGDLLYHKGTIFSPSLLVCLCTQTLFPSNKHFTCFTSFHLFVEIRFYQQARALSLAADSRGLVDRTQCCPFQSLAGNKNSASRHCWPRPLQISERGGRERGEITGADERGGRNEVSKKNIFHWQGLPPFTDGIRILSKL